jgi:hypothetical protein
VALLCLSLLSSLSLAQTAGNSSSPASNQTSTSPSQDKTPEQLPNAPSSNPQAPSLGDLGFPAEATRSNPKEQALLDKRTHMLKVHQRMG